MILFFFLKCLCCCRCFLEKQVGEKIKSPKLRSPDIASPNLISSFFQFADKGDWERHLLLSLLRGLLLSGGGGNKGTVFF